MKIMLTGSSNNYIEITKHKDYLYILPCYFYYKKIYPTKTSRKYKKITNIDFQFLIWYFQIIIRNPIK